MKLPKICKGEQLREYFLEYCKPIPNKPDFYEVIKPLPAFKKAYKTEKAHHKWIPGGYMNIPVIVNLLIPKKAIIYADSECFITPHMYNRKMRCNIAETHSIINKYTKKEYTEAKAEYTRYDKKPYIYRKNKIQKPQHRFSYQNDSCASGIHFFLNLTDAYCY